MNALRGSIVVVVALVIAVVVLARGLDDAETSDTPDTTTTTAGAQPASPAASPSDPVPAPKPPPQTVAQPPAPPPVVDPIPPDIEDLQPIETPIAPPTPPTHNRDEVRVLVANGTSVCGAAGRVATSLSAQGFNVLPAANADNAADSSVLYFVEGYGADAGVLASLLQVDSAQVQPMPATPPTDPGDAHVLVYIGGDDLAQPNC